jgi:hypothetical protein
VGERAWHYREIWYQVANFAAVLRDARGCDHDEGSGMANVSVRGFYDETAALLRLSGITDIEPFRESERGHRLHFCHEGAAFVALGEPRHKTIAIVLGLRAQPGASASAPFARCRRATRLDLFAARVGLQRPIHTGDQVFDTSVWVETDATSVQLEAWLGRADVRSAITALLPLPTSEVRFTEYGCLATVLIGHLRTPAELGEITRQLRRLGAAFPTPVPASRPTPPIPSGVGRLRGFRWRLLGGVFAGGIWWWPVLLPDRYTPLTNDYLGPAFALSGAVLAALFLVWFPRYRQRPHGARLLVYGGLGALLAVPSVCFPTLLLVNAAPAGPPRERTVGVTGTDCHTTSRGGSLCYVQLRDTDGRTLRLPMNERTHLAGRCGLATLRVRPGRLGFERWEALTIRPDAPFVPCAKQDK